MRHTLLLSALAVLLAAGCTAEPASSSSVPDDGEPKILYAVSAPSGDLFPAAAERTAEVLTAAEQKAMERAVRAYIPPAVSLRVNRAGHFYYYDQLDEEAKRIYDAMLMVCDDPADENNISACVTQLDPRSLKFRQEWGLALYAMEYDHAELFWLYNEIETEMCASVPQDQDSSQYTVYFHLRQPYTEYEEKAAKFNKAAADLLKEIDTGRGDAEIARQIHDTLIGLVTYDDAAAEGGVRADYAHTAYGALVENSRGDAHHAVGDGYAQAYVYLLQQCGIDAAVILGSAGHTGDDAGRHAWTIVRLEDQWYETDPAWNDPDSLPVRLEEAGEGMDRESYEHYKEAFADSAYMDRISHCLYNMTTEAITAYTPAEGDYDYLTGDGKYIIRLAGESVHIRDTENREALFYQDLMRMAPVADGVKYGGY